MPQLTALAGGTDKEHGVLWLTLQRQHARLRAVNVHAALVLARSRTPDALAELRLQCAAYGALLAADAIAEPVNARAAYTKKSMRLVTHDLQQKAARIQAVTSQTLMREGMALRPRLSAEDYVTYRGLRDELRRQRPPARRL